MILTELRKFEKYIDSYTFTQYEQNGNNLRLKMIINFTDKSKVFIKEIVINGNKRKYGYNWINKDNELICRWDNAPDWTEIVTFPHHKHVRSEQNVKPSRNIEFSTIMDELITMMTK